MRPERTVSCVLLMLLLLVLPFTPAVDASPGGGDPAPRSGPVVFKEVLGFYPYWIARDAYKGYDLSLLTTIAWCCVDVRGNGTFADTHGWPNTALLQYAHDRGVKVVVVVASMQDSITDPILATYGQDLAANLLTLVESTGADGVNIDFEGIDATNSVNGQGNRGLLTKFMQTLSSTFWSVNSSYQISMDLPAVDWTGVFDGASLTNYTDLLMIMGYSYYWSGSSNAGPVAPLHGGSFNVTSSVSTYLQDIPREALLLGVPYYGYEWPTQDDSRGSATTGQGTSHIYTDMNASAAQYGRRWDDVWKTPWYAYQSGGQWYQGHYDDSESLGYKYDLVLAEDIAGIGIWALGYDSGTTELQDLIRTKFADLVPPSVSFTSPGNGSKVGGVVEVNITASDNRGIDTVELLIDALPVARFNRTPYTYIWDTTQTRDGPHTLRATASDAVGNSAWSEMTLTVDNSQQADTTPPSVSILAPRDNSTLTGDVNVVVQALDDTGIANVTLLIDGSVRGTWSEELHVYTWTAPPPGPHTITVLARDTSSNQGEASITVRMKNVSSPPTIPAPPEVLFTSPENGSTVPAGSTSILLVFSGEMDHASVERAFRLVPGANASPRWYGGSVVEFSVDLEPDTTYVGVVEGVAMSVDGVSMNSTYTFTFTTGPMPPRETGQGESPGPPYLMFVLGTVAGLSLAYIIYHVRDRRRTRGYPRLQGP